MQGVGFWVQVLLCQASTKLSPFEILYGRKCNTPITWSNPVDIFMLGPDLLKELELTMKQVQKNLKTAQDRQKNFERITSR